MDLNKDSGPSLSIVIPVYNEQSNISRLHAEIVQVCSENNYAFEIIIVDDGSTDKTGQIARSVSAVKYIRLLRNFSQTSALDEGIKSAVIFTHYACPVKFLPISPGSSARCKDNVQIPGRRQGTLIM